ncbi:cupin domain protein [Streptococcus downei F0415]|uniref:cupin domain-containing protein n=1 Tax=Streptococcus downei TaxID=1317 RepID=UPI0001E9AD99|nr:cupin domain-containing protein [Streptococcus downei]EFQ57484.1 cupin domain protein [Streptococcus downei F0415]
MIKVYKLNLEAKEIEKFNQNNRFSIRHIHLMLNQEIPTHSSSSDKVVIVLEGNIDFTASGETVKMISGDFVVLEPEEKHSLKGNEESQVLVVLHK